MGFAGAIFFSKHWDAFPTERRVSTVLSPGFSVVTEEHFEVDLSEVGEGSYLVSFEKKNGRFTRWLAWLAAIVVFVLKLRFNLRNPVQKINWNLCG